MPSIEHAPSAIEHARITFDALPHIARAAAYELLRAAPDALPSIVVITEKILQLRDQIGAVRVDADRKLREVDARSRDCEDHGKEIARLEELLDHFYRLSDRNNDGRAALVEGIFWIQNDLRQRTEAGVTTIEVARVDASLNGVLEAHDRAWQSPTPKARRAPGEKTDLPQGTPKDDQKEAPRPSDQGVLFG